MKISLLSILFAGTLAAQSIAPPVFTGTGLNDATSSGSYNGIPANHQYAAVVCTAATPDTVKFSRDGGSFTGCVSVTGAAQLMRYPAGSITAASWATGRATYTDAGHGLSEGVQVTVSGVTPSGYNQTCTVHVISSSQFSCALVSTPGAYVSGGTVLANDGVTIAWAATTGHTVADAWTVDATASGSSSASSFIARGVGARVRTDQDKARDVVSIKDFGGTDTQALQAAINSLQSTGGTILMPAGQYSLCAVTMRTTNPITISGYGAIINPTCANQYALTSFGNKNKILGASFLGVGGTQYQGIHVTADSTTQVTIYNLIRDVYMINMYNGILVEFDAAAIPSGAAYRAEIADTVIENFYNQKTWSGSFGISFDGTVNGNSGGNDSKVHGGGVKGYENNIIDRNSVGLKLQQMFIDGGLNAVLYDGGSDLEIDHLYQEFNTNVVTTASTLALPYLLTVIGGTQGGFTNCVNGSFFNGLPPSVMAAPSSCFLSNNGLIGTTTPGITEIYATNEIHFGPLNLGSGQTDNVAMKISSGNWLWDFTGLNNTRDFTLYRPGHTLYANAGNIFWDSLNLNFGTAASSHMQFPFGAGLGSALHSNGGAAGGANGLWIASNETAANTTGGTQANAALPSWALDIGGYDNPSFTDIDSFSIFRKPAAGAYSRLFSIDAAGSLSLAGTQRISSAGVGDFASTTHVGGVPVITNATGLVSCTVAGQAVKAVAITNSGNTITISATCAVP